jgi:HAD superfamily hydrolase (TIGR01490 family)
MSVVIFDLDNTLLGGDSDHAWGEFMAEKGLVDDEYRRGNDRFLKEYQAGQFDVLAYLEFLAKPMSHYSLAELLPLREEFLQTKIEPMYLPRAEKLLNEHRARGDRLLVITSTISFVTQPICEMYGIHDLLATELELNDGHFTGRVLGKPCFGSGKVLRLKSWLEENEQTLAGSYFYTDSLTDLPLLEFVENPVAVDPESSLEETAVERNWPVLKLREN